MTEYIFVHGRMWHIADVPQNQTVVQHVRLNPQTTRVEGVLSRKIVYQKIDDVENATREAVISEDGTRDDRMDVRGLIVSAIEPGKNTRLSVQ